MRDSLARVLIGTRLNEMDVVDGTPECWARSGGLLALRPRWDWVEGLLGHPHQPLLLWHPIYYWVLC